MQLFIDQLNLLCPEGHLPLEGDFLVFKIPRTGCIKSHTQSSLQHRDLNHGFKSMDRFTMWIIPQMLECKPHSVSLQRCSMRWNDAKLANAETVCTGRKWPGLSWYQKRWPTGPVLQRLSQGAVGEGRQIITKKSSAEISADVRSINKRKSLSNACLHVWTRSLWREILKHWVIALSNRAVSTLKWVNLRTATGEINNFDLLQWLSKEKF